jgi:hypothetical protein
VRAIELEEREEAGVKLGARLAGGAGGFAVGDDDDG